VLVWGYNGVRSAKSSEFEKASVSCCGRTADGFNPGPRAKLFGCRNKDPGWLTLHTVPVLFGVDPDGIRLDVDKTSAWQIALGPGCKLILRFSSELVLSLEWLSKEDADEGRPYGDDDCGVKVCKPCG